MKLRTVWRALLLTVTAAVLLVVAACGWLYFTESGARFALARALEAADGALAVGRLEGRLSDGLRLYEVRYGDDARTVEIDELGLRADFPRLLAGRLAIDNLTTSVIRYRELGTAAGPDAPARALPVVDLPLTVQLSRTAIAGIEIERDGAEPVVIEQLVLSGDAAGMVARIRRLEFRVRGFFISMQGRAGWEEAVSVDGVVSWSGEVEESVLLGNARVTGRWPEFVFEQKTIEPIAQTAIGSITVGATPEFDLVIEQPELGGARLTGTFDPATTTLRARVEAEGLAPGAFIPDWPGQLDMNGSFVATAGTPWRFEADDLNLAARFDDEILRAGLDGVMNGFDTFAIDRFSLEFGANRAELSGTIDTALDLDIAAALVDIDAIGRFIERDDISRLLPAFELPVAVTGRAGIDLAVTGERQAPLVAGRVSLQDSAYAGLPLALTLAFASPVGGAETIAVEQFDVRLGASRVTGSGNVGAGVLARDAERREQAAIDLGLTLEAGDLAELAALPIAGLEAGGLAGRGEARMRVTGRVGRADIDAEADVADLRYDTIVLDSARASAQFGLYAGAATSGRLAVSAPDWSGDMSAAGVLDDNSWSGSVTTLTIDEPWLGDWVLAAPVPVRLAPQLIEVTDACLVHAASGVCVDWRTGGSEERISIDADDFDLGVLTPLLPETVALHGRITLDAILDAPRRQPSGTLNARGAGIGIDIVLGETDRVETVLESIELDALLDDYAFELKAAVENRAGGTAGVVMATPDLRDRDAAISGALDLFWPDLTALSLLSPDIGEVGGTLAVSVDLGGSLANPEPSGTAELTGGRVSVPQWGVFVERIEAEARSVAGSRLEYGGRGYIAGSEVRISGDTEIDLEAGWPTRLRLTGNNVPIVQRPDATIYASPEFDVEIVLPRIDVAGRVVIPEALLAVETLPEQAVEVSPDSVVHGRAEPEAIRPIDMSADITVELGDNVRYTGSNLDTALAGTLRLQYQSGELPDASGGLTLSGSYDAYGQPLELERGELLFAGPLDDPAIDVLAVREIGSTRVGIRLSGTLRAPDISLFSDPPMSEPNALSYLRFGRPLTSTDGSETLTLEATALALGLQQALPAVQRVGDALLLDELTIAPTEVDAGSLMAGKYLGPKVYLSYTYGLFNRLGGFLLRYEINDRFSLETRSGNEKSMDFLYSVEKD